MTDTNYYFYSWLRENLASAIDQQPEKLRATIEITLDITSETNEKIDQDPPSKQIELYGPGDVLGFDSRIVTRTDPGPNVGDFEPNYFPIIEFAEPDFPWRFTPDKEDANDNLQPWIALIVLEDGEFKEEGTNEGGEQSKRPDKQLPPVISEVSTSSLPNLSESWRWAHIQVTGEANKEFSDSELTNIIQDEPERIISRLMCTRRLKSGTKYHAFVVPTFRCGRSVGLGREPDEYEKPLSCAWDKNGNKVDLPYYYKWEFRTGLRGDFEHLIRLLKPRPITGVGTRKIKCEDLDHISVSDLDLEGALCSPDTVFTQWGKDNNELEFRERLAELLYQPRADMAGSTSNTPKVVPPIYGRWHAARNEVFIKNDNINESWLDELNLDPRHRIAASFGAKVIKDQQESLMISAWDQLGDVEEANEKLRQAQIGIASSKSIYKRLPQDEDLLRLAAPFFSKVQMENRYTVQEHIQRSMVPLAICDPAFRRIQRPQGPIRKRQKAALNSQRLFDRSSKGGHKVVRTHPVYGNILENQTLKDTISTRVYEELDPRKKIIDRNKSILEREDLGIIIAHPTFPQPMYKFLQDISQELLLPGIEKIPQNTIGLLKTNRRFIEAYMCGLNHAFAAELLWREYPTDQRGSYFRQFWDYSDYMSKDGETRKNLEDIKPLDDWNSERLGMNKPAGRPKENLVLIIHGDLLKKYPNAVIYAVEAKLNEDNERVPALPESDEEGEIQSPVLSGTLPPDITFLGFNITEDEARGILFCWDEVPGKDSVKFIKFLERNHGVNWIKIDDLKDSKDNYNNDSIVVSSGDYSLSLLLNKGKTKAILKIDDKTYTFNIREEDNKLIIYNSKYPYGWYFIIEERVSETRFGLDETNSENSKEFKWDDLTWGHFKKKEVVPGDYLDGLKSDLGDEHIDEWNDDSANIAWKEVVPGDYLDGLKPSLGDEYIDEWNDGSANIAWITMQKPVRIIIHANQILP
jgi:hypothetical protein